MTHWLRQLRSLDQARSISFVASKASLSSFLFQEFEQLVLCGLVATALIRWHHHSSSMESEHPTDLKTESFLTPRQEGLALLVTHYTPRFAREMSRWQLASIAIGLFYGSTIAFYVSNIRDSGDLAYIPMALSFELVGLVLWWLVTRCAIQTWRNWARCRDRVVANAVVSTPADLEAVMRTVDAINPTSIAPTFASAVVAAVGFAMPIIQLLAHAQERPT